jgi:hypothetical protein
MKRSWLGWRIATHRATQEVFMSRILQVASSTPDNCDLCDACLGEIHQHLLERPSRKLECVCDVCANLGNDSNSKYWLVPQRVISLPKFQMTDSEWYSLMTPTGIAYLVPNSTLGRVVVLCPSPLGPMESLLPADAWNAIAGKNPILRTMKSDVEGLLVCRAGSVREHYVIPIDECFTLVGIVRRKWKGASGGTLAWWEIERFFEKLRNANKVSHTLLKPPTIGTMLNACPKTPGI